jgi:iron-sulfur cluster assembly protein
MAALTMTEKAANEVKRLVAAQHLPDGTGLRVAVKGGGCSGFTYSVALDHRLSAIDQVIDVHGARLIVDRKSLLYLVGTEVDYQDDLMGKGFFFKNPIATKSCGCGTSFAV